MSEPVDDAQIQQVRIDRGIGPNERWIVCSAGGGALGERLIEEFNRVAPQVSNAVIDIVQGPHSSLRPPDEANGTRVRLHRTRHDLSIWHAAADLVVCPGGYNSLLEVMEGGAPIIATSVQPDAEGEQALLVSRLSKHYPIQFMHNYCDLRDLIDHALRLGMRSPARISGALNFDGIQNGRQLVLAACPTKSVP